MIVYLPLVFFIGLLGLFLLALFSWPSKNKSEHAGERRDYPSEGQEPRIQTDRNIPRRESMAEPMRKAVDEKFCLECGEIIRAKAEICPKCGVRQFAPPTASGPQVNAQFERSKLAAALFALFLGGIGIHKFYLGRVAWGFVYLIFCWTFIPAIVGFIEAIVLLAMTQSDFHRKYG